MEAYLKAVELLRLASSKAGFLASTYAVDNYKRIWTRDGVINGLAALMTSEEDLIQTFKATLITIFDHQHRSGFLPSNVIQNGQVSYGGTVGRVDNISWGLIGLCHYSLSTGDYSLAHKYKKQVDRAIEVMEAWEFNGKHLMYVPQSGDWADEYIHHGYILFDQLLRIAALRLINQVYHDKEASEKAKLISETVVINFWKTSNQNLYAPNLARLIGGASDNYWMMGFNPSRIYSQFDLQANAFALLLKLGTGENQSRVINFVSNSLRSNSGMMPSYTPDIAEDEADMRELKGNFTFHFRNRPGEFHNGGLWPVWNGFLVAALISSDNRKLAENLYSAISGAVEMNEWEFNECFNRTSMKPAGIPQCTWSAGGLIIAYQALNGNQLLVR